MSSASSWSSHPGRLATTASHGILMLESMTMQQLWKGNASYSNGSGYLAEGRNVYDAAPERLVVEWRKRDETGQFRLFS